MEDIERLRDVLLNQNQLESEGIVLFEKGKGSGRVIFSLAQLPRNIVFISEQIEITRTSANEAVLQSVQDASANLLIEFEVDPSDEASLEEIRLKHLEEDLLLLSDREQLSDKGMRLMESDSDTAKTIYFLRELPLHKKFVTSHGNKVIRTSPTELKIEDRTLEVNIPLRRQSIAIARPEFLNRNDPSGTASPWRSSITPSHSASPTISTTSLPNSRGEVPGIYKSDSSPMPRDRGAPSPMMARSTPALGGAITESPLMSPHRERANDNSNLNASNTSTASSNLNASTASNVSNVSNTSNTSTSSNVAPNTPIAPTTTPNTSNVSPPVTIPMGNPLSPSPSGNSPAASPEPPSTLSKFKGRERSFSLSGVFGGFFEKSTSLGPSESFSVVEQQLSGNLPGNPQVEKTPVQFENSTQEDEIKLKIIKEVEDRVRKEVEATVRQKVLEEFRQQEEEEVLKMQEEIAKERERISQLEQNLEHRRKSLAVLKPSGISPNSSFIQVENQVEGNSQVEIPKTNRVSFEETPIIKSSSSSSPFNLKAEDQVEEDQYALFLTSLPKGVVNSLGKRGEISTNSLGGRFQENSTNSRANFGSMRAPSLSSKSFSSSNLESNDSEVSLTEAEPISTQADQVENQVEDQVENQDENLLDPFIDGSVTLHRGIETGDDTACITLSYTYGAGAGKEGDTCFQWEHELPKWIRTHAGSRGKEIFSHDSAEYDGCHTACHCDTCQRGLVERNSGCF
eukprot:TRINITY_DN5021_c0_g1_i2.p1 TRINITY_DN5021_c0_g1~~TRINITY_DN5021_c0_g1_i2.p1  ORF type:complete len:740 (+),score=289.35 TRINITY_DN5021_c0_g1_i2:272-2491(+)